MTTPEATKELDRVIVNSPNKTCPSYMTTKAKQKSVAKVSGHVKSKISNERIFIDIIILKIYGTVRKN